MITAEQLRLLADGDYERDWRGTFREAAETIEALTAERDEAKQLAEMVGAYTDQYKEGMEAAVARFIDTIDALTTELAELRLMLHHEGVEHSECQEALINAQAKLVKVEQERDALQHLRDL